ncbi:unnamed protein product [Closterium sp. NIES-54]
MLQIEAPAPLIGRRLYPGPYATLLLLLHLSCCCRTRCCDVPCRAALPEPHRSAPPCLSRATLPLLSRAAAVAAAAAAAAAAATAATATMATVSVLSFDAAGCTITFDIWLDDLQLYLQSEARDDIPLFAHTDGSLPAPPDTETANNLK